MTTPKAAQDVVDRVTISVRWGGKDGKWRWLVEVEPSVRIDPLPRGTHAGEERLLEDALMAAENAAHSIIQTL